MAVETAKNTRWYQVVTLKSLDKMISKDNVANAIKKIPIYILTSYGLIRIP